MKKLSALVLALVLVMGTTVMAKDEPLGYGMYYGTVEELADEGDYKQILVANEETQDGLDKLYLYTKDVTVIDLKTGEIVEGHEFKVGEKVQYFYREDTPVMQSLPAKMTPSVIAINAEDGEYSIDVDYFDKDGHGISNRLDINVTNDTKVVDLKGETATTDLEEEIIALYTVSTKSLPPMANVEKVIVLESRGTVDLEDYKTEEGYYLRKYYEAKGAKVEWNQDEMSTTITLNDKSILIKNMESILIMDEKEYEMDDFTVIDGTSYITKDDITKIDEYLK